MLNTARNTLKRIVCSKIVPYIAAYLTVCFFFYLSIGLGLNKEADGIFAALFIVLWGISVLVYLLIKVKKNGKITTNETVKIIIAIGFFMRLTIGAFLPYNYFSHDLLSKNSNGHMAFLYNIVENFSLPSVNEGQFYHPPLFHILGAIQIWIGKFFCPHTDWNEIVGFAAIVNCYLSFLWCVVSVKLLKHFKVDGLPLVFSTAFVCLFSGVIISSKVINNDTAMSFFVLLSVYLGVKWYSLPTVKSIVFCALSFACAVSSKIGGATVAVFLGVLFLWRFVLEIKQKQWKKTLVMFAVFIAVAAPLSLWYPIRNYIKFGQPLTYVLDLGKKNFQYLGDLSLFERFFSFPLADALKTPVYSLPKNGIIRDANTWILLIKTSLFDESQSMNNAVGSIGIVLSCLIVLLVGVSGIKIIFKQKLQDKACFWAFIIYAIILLGSFVKFAVDYPFVCTSSFRYVQFFVPLSALVLGISLSRTNQKSVLSIINYCIIGLFSIFSFIAVW